MGAKSKAQDPLTGALSRLALHEMLDSEVERAVRSTADLALLVLDLDHFKSINDAFGHLRGDAALTELVRRLKKGIRSTDLLFRYGGDEFVILLPKTDLVQAVALAERLIDAITSSPMPGEPPVALSASIGIAAFPQEASTPEKLFAKADLRLHEAKRQGRGRIMAEDPVDTPHLPFSAVSRLIGREDALAAVHRFFGTLAAKKRGILVITGQHGSGRTRFLEEVMAIAEIRGMPRLAVRGNPALKTRSFGALTTALDDKGIRALPSSSRRQLMQHIEEEVWARSSNGLVCAVDNIVELDSDSLDLLQELMLHHEIPALALAYTSDMESSRRLFPLEAPLREAIELEPLSRDEARIWLRLLLKWEVEDEFFDWLFQETRGLPLYLEEGLSYLVRRGVIRMKGNRWIIEPDYRETTLADKLGVLATPPPHNLPVALTMFIGRDAEIRSTERLLHEHRMVSIVGPPGIGKTRLALQAAAELIEQFHHGVYWVPLEASDTSDLLLTGIANALGFTFYANRSPIEQLRNHLREKCLLLVLDSFEHLTETADVVAQLLRHAPDVHIMTTSCERLNVEGEAVLELGGLEHDLRGVGAVEGRRAAEQSDASRLFIQSARRVSPEFIPDETDDQAIGSICRLLQGMPLGIELAASWVKVLDCAEIEREIERGLDFLSTKHRNLPERHRSLRAVFTHSWSLLSHEERAVFSRLSIFRGGLDRNAAQAVAGADLHMLSVLADKSFLRRSTAGRYAMPEVLRSYAAERLDETPDEKRRVEEMHRAYYAAFLQEREASLRDSRQGACLQEIAEDKENVRSAWRSSIDQNDAKLVNRAVHPLFLFYERRGSFAEGKDSFDYAERTLASHGASSVADQATLAAVQSRYAVFLLQLGEYADARGHLLNALSMFEEQGNHREMAFALHYLGTLSYRQGEYAASEEHYRRSCELYAMLEDKPGIALSLNNQANLAYRMGRFEDAVKLNDQSLALSLELNDQWGIANSYNNLGIVADAMGEYEKARELYQQSIEIKRRLDDRWGVANSLNNLGNVALQLADYDEARRLLEDSLRIKEEIGDRWRIAITLNNLALVAHRVGDVNRAKVLHRKALDLREKIGDKRGICSSLINLGNVMVEMGELADAEGQLRTALKMARDIDALPLALSALRSKAAVFLLKEGVTKALEILYLVRDHPATQDATRAEAIRDIRRAEENVSKTAIQAARTRAEELSLTNFIEESLEA